jgi:site-specific DNA-methyltransferase (adenine-specific)
VGGAVKPYYEQDGITIYHGDCREVLPVVGRVDLLLADPPYGVNFVVQKQIVGVGNRRIAMGGKPPVYGDDKPFDPSHLLHFGRVILFGANHYSDKLPVSGGWIVWDKTGGGRGPDNSFADCELAWTNVRKTPDIYHHLWKGLVRDSEVGDKVLHPTQKPVALMRWLITKYTQPQHVVVDPYMGSGPVLLAAKETGRRAVGIEFEERYCEIAANRLSQGVLALEATA